jgi:hypothetical protein
MGILRNGRGVAVAVATVGLVQAIAFPSIAHAGFFDFLFGPSQTRVRPYEGYFGGMPHWGTDQGLRRRAHGHRLTARRKLLVADNHPVGPRRPTDLMDDESLRRGDAVMTATGIRIFIGSSGTPHAPEDFRKLSEIKRLSKVERKALAALDLQGTDAGGKPSMTTGRSATGLKVTVGETIIDPQGRSIRYVGP